MGAVGGDQVVARPAALGRRRRSSPPRRSRDEEAADLGRAYISPARSSKRRISVIVSSHSRASSAIRTPRYSSAHGTPVHRVPRGRLAGRGRLRGGVGRAVPEEDHFARLDLDHLEVIDPCGIGQQGGAQPPRVTISRNASRALIRRAPRALPRRRREGRLAVEDPPAEPHRRHRRHARLGGVRRRLCELLGDRAHRRGPQDRRGVHLACRRGDQDGVLLGQRAPAGEGLAERRLGERDSPADRARRRSRRASPGRCRRGTPPASAVAGAPAPRPAGDRLAPRRIAAPPRGAGAPQLGGEHPAPLRGPRQGCRICSAAR